MAFLPMLLIEVYIKTLLRFYNLLIIITILPIPFAAYAVKFSRVEFEGNIVTDTCQSVVINEKLNINCSIKNIEMSSSIDDPPQMNVSIHLGLKKKSGLIQSVTYKLLSKEKTSGLPRSITSKLSLIYRGCLVHSFSLGSSFFLLIYSLNLRSLKDSTLYMKKYIEI